MNPTMRAAARKLTPQSFILRTGTCGDNRLLGVQTIAEVVGDHAVRFHIATVMYGWRLALVAEEPCVLVVPEYV